MRDYEVWWPPANEWGKKKTQSEEKAWNESEALNESALKTLIGVLDREHGMCLKHAFELSCA